MFCENCGKSINPDMNFCPYCAHPTSKKVSFDADINAVPEHSFSTKPIEIPPTQEDFSSDTPKAMEQTDYIHSDFNEMPPENNMLEVASDVSSPETTQNTPSTTINNSIEEILEAESIIPSAPSIETSTPGEKNKPSQNTLHNIDLALATDMETNMKASSVTFQEPPLYIPQSKKNKIIPVIVIIIIVLFVGLGALFVANGGLSTLFGTAQSPMVLSNGGTNLAFGMTPEHAITQLGEPLRKEDNKVFYNNGVSIVYRNNKAVNISLSSSASSKWKTSEKNSLGDTRSAIFKAYGTDNLVQVMEAMGHLDDAAKISQLTTYLIPYQFENENLTQITLINKVDYDNNPNSYYWIAIRVNEVGQVDYISIGDSAGIFEQS